VKQTPGPAGTAQVIALVYVDDILLTSSNSHSIDEVKMQLKKDFKITDNGDVKTFLGMTINRPTPTGPVTIHQQDYVKKLLHEHYMSDCNSTITPLPPHLELPVTKPTDQDREDEEQVDAPRYRQLVGQLVYLAYTTRPDLAQATRQLTRGFSKSTTDHERAAKHVLRYLRGTTSKTLKYTSDQQLTGFVDASFAGEPTTSKSTTGYVFLMHGAAVTWGSALQDTVATSTAHAEYIALYTATCEAVYLQQLTKEILWPTPKPTKIYEDNTTCIKFAVEGSSKRCKFIATKYHYTREQVEKGNVEVKHLRGEEMTADIFTKSLPGQAHRKHVATVFGDEQEHP
jgi:hypothetical protein